MKTEKTKNMKRYLLIIAMLLGAVSTWGQTVADQAAVLQKIIDLPGLQQYFPMGADQSFREVYVVQNPTAFDANLQLSKFGKSVQFVDAKVVETLPVGWFEFESFSISGNVANATFDFHYFYNRVKTMQHGTVVLSKTNGNWTITETKLSGR